MSKFNPLPREEIIQSSNKDVNLLSKRCRRFNPFYQLWGDSRRGVIFLKLREDGCNKKTALAYSSKPICREDSTRMVNGPAGCRTLQVKNHSILTSNGWQFTDLMYNLGKKFYTGAEDFLKIDEFDDLLQKHFLANEEKIKGDFKKKIKNLSEFYAHLNQKYNFSHLKKKELFEKLKKMKEELLKQKEKKKEIEKTFIPCGNLRMKSLVSETLENEAHSPSLITDLSVFPKYKLKRLTSSEEEVQFKPHNALSIHIMPPPKLEPSHDYDDFLKHRKSLDVPTTTTPLLKSSPFLRQSTMVTLESNSRTELLNPQTQTENPAEPQPQKPGIDLAKKASLFRNLEAQNRFINAITNDETFTEIVPEVRKKSSKPLLPAPLLANSSAFPAKSLIAEEFNRANYMYGNEQEQKSSAISIKSAQQKSILKHRRTLKSIRMGFDPEDLEKKTHEILFQHKQSVIAQSIRQRKKDVSFIEPEGADKKKKVPRTSNIVYRPKEKISITPFPNTEDPQQKKEKIQKKIEFLGTECTIGKEKEKAEKDSNSEDEGDDILKEIRFQRDLKKFVRGTINSQNSRRGSLNVDMGNLEEIWGGIKEMRREKDNFGRSPKKSEKAKNLKNMMSATYQNFFQHSSKFSQKEKNKSANGFFSAKNSSNKNSCFN